MSHRKDERKNKEKIHEKSQRIRRKYSSSSDNDSKKKKKNIYSSSDDEKRIKKGYPTYGDKRMKKNHLSSEDRKIEESSYFSSDDNYSNSSVSKSDDIKMRKLQRKNIKRSSSSESDINKKRIKNVRNNKEVIHEKYKKNITKKIKIENKKEDDKNVFFFDNSKDKSNAANKNDKNEKKEFIGLCLNKDDKNDTIHEKVINSEDDMKINSNIFNEKREKLKHSQKSIEKVKKYQKSDGIDDEQKIIKKNNTYEEEKKQNIDEEEIRDIKSREQKKMDKSSNKIEEKQKDNENNKEKYLEKSNKKRGYRMEEKIKNEEKYVQKLIKKSNENEKNDKESNRGIDVEKGEEKKKTKEHIEEEYEKCKGEKKKLHMNDSEKHKKHLSSNIKCKEKKGIDNITRNDNENMNNYENEIEKDKKIKKGDIKHTSDSNKILIDTFDKKRKRHDNSDNEKKLYEPELNKVEKNDIKNKKGEINEKFNDSEENVKKKKHKNLDYNKKSMENKSRKENSSKKIHKDKEENFLYMKMNKESVESSNEILFNKKKAKSSCKKKEVMSSSSYDSSEIYHRKKKKNKSNKKIQINEKKEKKKYNKNYSNKKSLSYEKRGVYIRNSVSSRSISNSSSNSKSNNSISNSNSSSSSKSNNSISNSSYDKSSLECNSISSKNIVRSKNRANKYKGNSRLYRRKSIISSSSNSSRSRSNSSSNSSSSRSNSSSNSSSRRRSNSSSNSSSSRSRSNSSSNSSSSSSSRSSKSDNRSKSSKSNSKLSYSGGKNYSSNDRKVIKNKKRKYINEDNKKNNGKNKRCDGTQNSDIYELKKKKHNKEKKNEEKEYDPFEESESGNLEINEDLIEYAKKKIANVTTEDIGKSGGVYIPPFKLERLKNEVTNKKSTLYQRQEWMKLKKKINNIVNKVNVDNISEICYELFECNLIRGKGLFSRALIHAQLSSPAFTNVFACLLSVVNSKFPNIGLLTIQRVILHFRRAYQRGDKILCFNTVKFIAHMINQRILHEIVGLQLCSLLLQNITNDSIQVCTYFLVDVGQLYMNICRRGLDIIFDRLKDIIQEGKINIKTQYDIEKLWNYRKSYFSEFPTVIEELDLIDENEKIVHEIDLLDESFNNQEELNIFKEVPYEQFEEENIEWNNISNELLHGITSDKKEKKKNKKDEYDRNSSEESKSSDADSENEDIYKEKKKCKENNEEDSEEESSSDSEEDNNEEESNDSNESEEDYENNKEEIKDMTEQYLINLRKNVYLSIMSSLSFEECVHKLLKLNIKKGYEIEICNMLIDCCCMEKTFQKFYALQAERLCKLKKIYQENFEKSFENSYNTAHRLETAKLRNCSKFFAHLLYTDAISWSVFMIIKLTEENTTSSTRIFIKILLQELTNNLGLQVLYGKINHPSISPFLSGLFPTDNAQNIRFCINFFTAIGLGALTTSMRKLLLN